MSSAVTQKGIANHEAIAAAKAGEHYRSHHLSFRTVTSNHHPFRCKRSRAFGCRHICSRRGPRQRCCARLCSANPDLCTQTLATLTVTPHAAVPVGLTDTRLAARIMSSEPAKQMSLAMHALGRFGSASDCASVVDLLLDSSR